MNESVNDRRQTEPLARRLFPLRERDAAFGRGGRPNLLRRRAFRERRNGQPVSVPALFEIAAPRAQQNDMIPRREPFERDGCPPVGRRRFSRRAGRAVNDQCNARVARHFTEQFDPGPDAFVRTRRLRIRQERQFPRAVEPRRFPYPARPERYLPPARQFFLRSLSEILIPEINPRVAHRYDGLAVEAGRRERTLVQLPRRAVD